MPDGDDVLGIGEVEGGVVEQHIAKAPARHDAQRRIDQQIVEAEGVRAWDRAPEAVVAHQFARIGPAQQQARDIGQRIPANRQRPEAERHGVDLRIGDHRWEHLGFRKRLIP